MPGRRPLDRKIDLPPAWPRRVGPAPVRQTLDQVVRGLRLTAPSAEQRVLEAFTQLLDERFRSSVRPIRLRDRELIVQVASAAHRHELKNFHAARLLKELNRLLAAGGKCAPTVQRLNFRSSV